MPGQLPRNPPPRRLTASCILFVLFARRGRTTPSSATRLIPSLTVGLRSYRAARKSLGDKRSEAYRIERMPPAICCLTRAHGTWTPSETVDLQGTTTRQLSKSFEAIAEAAEAQAARVSLEAAGASLHSGNSEATFSIHQVCRKRRLQLL